LSGRASQPVKAALLFSNEPIFVEEKLRTLQMYPLRWQQWHRKLSGRMESSPGSTPAITAGQQSQTHAAKIQHGGGDPLRAYQLASLSRFLDDGSTEIANNAERAIRPMGSDAKTVCSPYQIGVVNRQPPLGR
jgi:hypothetical protein